jgi:hypothetical protein
MHRNAFPTTRHAALAALVAAVVMLVAVPVTASAKTICKAGEFCLYSNEDLTGGLYHFGGTDSNLFEDVFENEDTNQVAGLLSESAANLGVKAPSHRNDVAVYPRPHFKGKPQCIRRLAGGNLRRGDVGSFKWVTRARCNRMPTAIAAHSPVG